MQRLKGTLRCDLCFKFAFSRVPGNKNIYLHVLADYCLIVNAHFVASSCVYVRKITKNISAPSGWCCSPLPGLFTVCLPFFRLSAEKAVQVACFSLFFVVVTELSRFEVETATDIFIFRLALTVFFFKSNMYYVYITLRCLPEINYFTVYGLLLL